MGLVQDFQRKYNEEGVATLLEAIWRNTLRRTPFGSVVESIGSEVLVEKLVMAPNVGYWPKIREPRSFNEKIMHRKLLTDKDSFSTLSDKAAAREYVRQRVGSHILNDVYHITDDPGTIPFESLPSEFVVKSTHASGHVRLVEDKSDIDVDLLRDECREWLSQEFGVAKGEYWYGDIKPQIIIEKFLRDGEGSIPPDFKFFVFHGTVECIQVDQDRFSNHLRRFYTPDWEPLDVEFGYPLGPEIDKPDQLETMLNIAESLGEGFDFVRVDLYQVSSGSVVFGEMTFAPESGSGRFRPLDYDFALGEKW